MKYLNKYSVYRNGLLYLNDIVSYEDAMNVVSFITLSVNFTEKQVADAITEGFTASGGDLADKLGLLRFTRKFWSKPNRFGIVIKAQQTNDSIEYGRVSDLENVLLRTSHAFNGKGLKKNTIEESSKWKPGRFQHKDVMFALSVWRNKGWSTLGKTKERKASGADYYTALTVQGLKDHSSYRELPYIDTQIRRLLALGHSPCEVNRLVRKNWSGSNKKLKDLIGQLA